MKNATKIKETKENLINKEVIKKYKAVLVGNPNCGKTLLFNGLTGSNQYVGNWPGVTVDKKIGKVLKNGKFEGELIDLPGIYSLSSYTMEERVSRDCILDTDPDVIINIVDGTNIERNLYLTLQVLEIGKPMVMLINMMDEVKKRGDKINCEKLSKILGITVIPISAKHKVNIDKVKEEVERLSKEKPIPPRILYKQNTYNTINKIQKILAEEENHHNIPFRFYATKLLEDDTACIETLELSTNQCERIEEIIEQYEKEATYGDRQTILSDSRYHYIERVVKETVVKKHPPGQMTISDKIDKIVTNKYLSYPIFFLILFSMFLLTFQTIGGFLQKSLQNFFNGTLTEGVSNFLVNQNAADWTRGLLVDGILTGVGAVISFIPLIAILFFFLSLLEDTGYMARAAFIMDKIFSKFGLTGRSFIPMIMGFGCSVPAIMATRTVSSEKDRRLTIILTPFMSCGAKLPVYALFATTFFPKYQGVVIFSMYIIGMAVSVISGLILSKTVFKGKKSPFVMELPPYRVPSLRSTLKLTWEKSYDFLRRAGTLIFAMSVLLWFLQAFNLSFQMVDDNSGSILAYLGAFIAPILIPLGFGTWQAAVAVLSGFIAKEAVVSTMAVVYASKDSETMLTHQLQNFYTPAAALSMMTFILLSTPCIAACATIKREMNSWKWAFMTYGYQLLTAYIVSLMVFFITNLFL